MSEIDDLESDAHGYFVPMVDMLAGVIFILVILLAAGALVSRSDFAKNSHMHKEVQKIEKELQQARQAQATYLEPRRIARLAMLRLLQDIQSALKDKGIGSHIAADRGRLLIDGPAFDPANAQLSAYGSVMARTVAEALNRNVPCLARSAARQSARCAPYGGAVLQDLSVVAMPVDPKAPASRTDMRALQFMTAVADSQPALLLQRATDGHRVLDSHSGDAQATEQQASASGSEVGLEIRMEVPRIP